MSTKLVKKQLSSLLDRTIRQSGPDADEIGASSKIKSKKKSKIEKRKKKVQQKNVGLKDREGVRKANLEYFKRTAVSQLPNEVIQAAAAAVTGGGSQKTYTY